MATRKFGNVLPTDWKEKVKQQRYLLTRCFSHDEIQDIYANFFALNASDVLLPTEENLSYSHFLFVSCTGSVSMLH
ncbi:MAG: hypothetical protein ACSLEN_00170 [Candidatus Malihini olakiniferum]